jgi:HEAT repeat protein
MADGVQSSGAAIDPEGLLRSALEKIVFFECRVSQLEAELGAAVSTAERARGDAAAARRREVELSQIAAAEKGARADAEARGEELAERVRLLEAERERLLSGLVERARVDGAPGSDGAPAPEESGAELAGFIAELRAEIEALRAWKAAAEAGGHVPLPAAAPVRAARGPETVPALAGRFEAEGRVGLTGRDAERLKGLLSTRADRVLYERSLDDLGADDARSRLRAVRALEALGSRAAAPLLAAALGRDPDPAVKAAILSALARFREPFAAELAARALDDGRPAVRVAALEALAAVAEGAAEPKLADALSDPSPLVRRRAALLLGFTAGERAEAALSVALGDPDRGVARAAAAALSGRPTARAQGALARALEHPEGSVRRAAAAALSRVAGEAVSADASPTDRRAVSRRIAERLAAMDAGALRDAVMRGAEAAPAARAGTTSAPATGAVSAPARGAASASGSRSAPASGSPPGAAPAPARRAVAVMVAEATSSAPAPSGLSVALLAEVRAALRGCTAADLVAAVGAPPDAVDSALVALAAGGTLVQRGARWFMP